MARVEPWKLEPRKETSGENENEPTARPTSAGLWTFDDLRGQVHNLQPHFTFTKLNVEEVSMIEKYCDSREASKILGVTVSAVHRLVGRGRLAALWSSGRRVFLRSAVLSLSENEDYQAKSRRRNEQ